MSTYILDTNILTDLETPGTPAYDKIMDKIANLPEESDVCFSILTAYEYQHGIAKASEELAGSLKKSWQTFLDLFEVLPLSLEGAELYGKLKTQYEKHTGTGEKEVKRPTVDLLLAATALVANAIIVSDDGIFPVIKEFTPTLKLENWKK